MPNPAAYDRNDWSAWYQRVRTVSQLGPALTDDLRTARDMAPRALIATAAATLVELDEDIVAGELLAREMARSAGGFAAEGIVAALSDIAQDLLQAIVDARSSPGERLQ
ncbi:hypothetical protein [uncultured Devosia sp.]|uniref:hypothetical protein n=1 Tax=uncultured Devosia sp. TaxID=211434 RepID=UPI0035CB6C58